MKRILDKWRWVLKTFTSKNVVLEFTREWIYGLWPNDEFSDEKELEYRTILIIVGANDLSDARRWSILSVPSLTRHCLNFWKVLVRTVRQRNREYPLMLLGIPRHMGQEWNSGVVKWFEVDRASFFNSVSSKRYPTIKITTTRKIQKSIGVTKTMIQHYI